MQNEKRCDAQRGGKRLSSHSSSRIVIVVESQICILHFAFLLFQFLTVRLFRYSIADTPGPRALDLAAI
jgi:hypothetical protein